MEKSRKIFAVSATLWAFAILFWPNAAEEHGSTSTNETREGLYRSTLTRANQGILGLKYYETKENKKHWEIESEFAELHRKENYAFLRSVLARFFSRSNGNVVQTQSDFGRSYLDKNEVELEKNVSIRSRRGYLFTMNKLRYLGQPHEFYSNEEIHMKGPSVNNPNMFVRGVGLFGSVDREYFNILSKTYAQRRLKSGDWVRIQASNGEFWTEEQRAMFGGRVRSVLPKAIIDSDKLELLVSDQKEAIRALGNVTVLNRERVGKAELAYLELGSNQIVLEGSASIDAKNNKLKGKRIKIYSDDDRIEVEGAEGRMSQ